MSKRFYLFIGADYYAAGGLSDYQGAYATLEDALAQTTDSPYAWWQIATIDEQGDLVLVRQRGNQPWRTT